MFDTLYIHICVKHFGMANIIFIRFVDRPSEYNDSLFFTNLIHKFFILIRLLYSSTCFEYCCAHLKGDNCVSTASGIVTLFG